MNYYDIFYDQNTRISETTRGEFKKSDREACLKEIKATVLSTFKINNFKSQSN